MEVPDDLANCPICRDIWRGFTEFRNAERIKAEPPGDSSTTECPGHEALIKAAADRAGFRLDDPDTRRKLRFEATGFRICLYIDGRLRKSNKLADYWLCGRESVPGHKGVATAFDKDWIDFSQVREWMARCVLSHGDACHNPMKISFERPAWLIDTQEGCLVPGSVCSSYIALSYVWGQAARDPVTGEAIEKMRLPGELFSPEIWDCLPLTIQHVIRLTPMLGERYVWIDALCIDHRNPEESTRELGAMGLIYMGAALTIILEDGDASDGLIGIRGVSPSRHLRHSIVPFGKSEHILESVKYPEEPRETKIHDERGWTFQEYLLSRRRLSFSRSQGIVSWECQCGAWTELFDHRTDNGDGRLDHKTISSGLLVPEFFGMIMRNFNARDLSFDEDALPGIRGMMAVLSTSPILYGLPEVYFEAALGWQPKRFMRRRKKSTRSNAIFLGPNALPSWSWIGWHGDFRMALSEACDRREFTSLRKWKVTVTSPITTWYARRSLDQIPGRAINSSWYSQRDKMKAESVPEPLPEGWTKDMDETSLKNIWFPKGWSRETFRLGNDNDSESSWYWPLVAPADHRGREWLDVQEQFIACATRRAWVQAYREPDLWHLNVVDTTGEAVGTIAANVEAGEQDALERRALAKEPERLELVAIAKFTFYEHQAFETTVSAGVDYVSVLWIEWEDGIARRLGSGRVLASVWETLHLEHVDLVLG